MLRPLNYTKNCKELKKGRSRRDGLPQGRVQQLVLKHQMVNPENIHTNNIIQSNQVIFKKIYAYTYLHAITVNEKQREKEAMKIYHIIIRKPDWIKKTGKIRQWLFSHMESDLYSSLWAALPCNSSIGKPQCLALVQQKEGKKAASIMTSPTPYPPLPSIQRYLLLRGGR